MLDPPFRFSDSVIGFFGPWKSAKVEVPILQQEVQLAENARQVGAIHLIDDQHERLPRVGLRIGCDPAQWPGLYAEGGLTRCSFIGSVALEEVFVGVGGVKLNKLLMAGVVLS